MAQIERYPRLKKSLGQVFLKETWPCKRIVERLVNWKVKRVLEIGPGGGVLTRELLARGFKVTAVEKDDRFASKLEDFKKTFVAENGADLDVCNVDVLKFKIEEWLDSSNEPCAVVGNIPYNISSSILLWVLPYIDRLKGVSFLVQLEFAERLASATGLKSYGSLSVFAQLRSHVVLDCKVDRSCFVPVPRVDSAIVSLSAPKDNYSQDLLKHVEIVSRLAFQQRRKKMLNAVSALLEGKNRDSCPVDLNRRPDSIRPEEYIQLAQFFFDGVQVDES